MQFTGKRRDGYGPEGSIAAEEDLVESISLKPTSLSAVSHHVPSEFLDSIAILFLLPGSTNSSDSSNQPFASPNGEDELNNVIYFPLVLSILLRRTPSRINPCLQYHFHIHSGFSRGHPLYMAKEVQVKNSGRIIQVTGDVFHLIQAAAGCDRLLSNHVIHLDLAWWTKL